MNPLNDQTAGALATPMVPIATVRQTVGEIFTYLETRASEFETVDYIYVLDNRKLVGVLSLHELLSAKNETPVATYMTSEIAYVHRSTDQEHVAQLALAQSIKAVPVINDDGTFFGVVTADTILRILRDEQTEDMMRLAGIPYDADDTLAKFTLRQHIVTRLPWLIVGLMGGIGAAFVVEHFDTLLATEIALAAFIPAIVYIADAVGSQTQMVYVRSLVHKQKQGIFKVLGREVTIAVIVGLLLGTLIGLTTFLWFKTVALPLTLGLAVFATVLFSVIVAVLLPWVFHRYGQDPALATGPLATVIRDISSLLIYFFIAAQLVL
jgi:magnesium transporter